MDFNNPYIIGIIVIISIVMVAWLFYLTVRRQEPCKNELVIVDGKVDSGNFEQASRELFPPPSSNTDPFKLNSRPSIFDELVNSNTNNNPVVKSEETDRTEPIDNTGDVDNNPVIETGKTDPPSNDVANGKGLEVPGSITEDTEHAIPLKTYNDGLDNFKHDIINISNSTFPYTPVKLPVTLPLRVQYPDSPDKYVNLVETDSVISLTGTLKDLNVQFLDESKVPREFISIVDDVLQVNGNKTKDIAFKDGKEKTMSLRLSFEFNKYTLIIEIGDTIQQNIFNFNIYSRSYLYIDGKVNSINISDINSRL